MADAFVVTQIPLGCCFITWAGLDCTVDICDSLLQFHLTSGVQNKFKNIKSATADKLKTE